MQTKTNKFFTAVAAIFLVGFSVYVLKELQSILLPFLLAVIIALIFEPFYEWLKSKKIPSAAAIIIILLIIVIIANVASLLIITSINSFSSEFPKYELKLRNLSESLITSLKIPPDEVQSINESLKLTNLLKQGSITGTLTSVFTSVVGVFGDFVLILIYIIFLLAEMSSIRQRIVTAFSEERAKKIADTLNEIFVEVRKYISRKTLINLFQGVVFGFILWLFGVDFYLLWGFLCFLSHYIPNVGPFISTVLPAITALLQFDSIITPLILTVLLIAVQNIIGSILEPRYIGDKLDLSPLLLLVSLIFWGYVWGVVGMIISIPLMSMIKIILSKFESTQSVSVMMSYSRKWPR